MSKLTVMYQHEDGTPIESLTMRDQREDGRWYERTAAEEREHLDRELYLVRKQLRQFYKAQPAEPNDLVAVKRTREHIEQVSAILDRMQERIR